MYRSRIGEFSESCRLGGKINLSNSPTAKELRILRNLPMKTQKYLFKKPRIFLQEIAKGHIAVEKLKIIFKNPLSSSKMQNLNEQ